MFRGINAINVDAKGRLAVPARYRPALETACQGQLVVTIDTEERCLLIYPLTQWENIERKIAALPSFNKSARRVQRLLIGHASEMELDSHGRVVLPPVLRQYASIEKRVVLIGQGPKFELWDEAHWNERRECWLQEESSGDDDDLPQDMQALSL